MHPLFKHLSMFTWMDVLETKEKCISFLEDLELIPKKTDCAPVCPKCSSCMSAVRSHYSIGWRWDCKKRRDKPRCPGIVNPLDGTFFQGFRTPFTEVLALMFGYIMKMSSTDIKEHLDSWRKSRNENQISSSTVLIYYKQFDEIVLNCLNMRGEALETEDKKSREKLLAKYCKTLNVQPIFRNIAFQFLMDIKSKYPCFKRKDVSQNANSSAASTNSNKENESDKVQYLNSLSTDGSDSNLSTADSSHADSSPNNTCLTSVSKSKILINTVSDKCLKSSSYVSGLSINQATETDPCKRLKTSGKIAVSIKDSSKNTTTCKNSISAKNKVAARKSHTSKAISDSPSNEKNSITKELNLIRNEHNIKINSVFSLNPAVTSPSMISTITNLLNENSNTSYCCDTNNSFTFPKDLSMDIDHAESVKAFHALNTNSEISVIPL